MGFDHPDYLGEGEGIRTLDTLMSCLGDTAGKSGMQYSKGAEVFDGNGHDKQDSPFHPVKLPAEGGNRRYYMNFVLRSSVLTLRSEYENPISAEELSQLRAYIRARIMMLFENSLQTATPVDEKAKDRIGASLLTLLDLDDADFNAAIADRNSGVLTLLKKISDFNKRYLNLDAALSLLEKITGVVRSETGSVFQLTDLAWEKDEGTQSKDRRDILASRLEYFDAVEFAIKENPRLIESACQRFPSQADCIVRFVNFLMRLTSALKTSADMRALWFCGIFNGISESETLTDQDLGSRLNALQERLSEKGITEQKVVAAILSF